MIQTLLLFILSSIRVSLGILRMTIIKALLPRMPLPNWRKEAVTVVRVGGRRRRRRQVEHSLIREIWRRGSTSPTSSSLRDGFESTNSDKEVTRFNTPKYPTMHDTVPVDKVDTTPTKPASIEFGFSIYADPVLQDSDTRYLLTPLRSAIIREVNFTLLKNASERVSEILRENRRRLDAGEDLNTIRKEARRKRSMEISAARRGRAKLFPFT